MAQAELDALIIANLQDLESAGAHIRDVLQKEVGAAMDDIVKSQISGAGWNGEIDWDEDGIWVAPKTWLKPEKGVGDDYLCQFSLEADDSTKGEDDFFWISQLVGAAQAQIGYRWVRNDVAKGRWRKAVGQQSDLIDRLRKLGFAYVESDGSFFLPVRIDAGVLAQAMTEEAPEQALQPLQDAFERLVTAAPIFDELLAAVVAD